MKQDMIIDLLRKLNVDTLVFIDNECVLFDECNRTEDTPPEDKKYLEYTSEGFRYFEGEENYTQYKQTTQEFPDDVMDVAIYYDNETDCVYVKMNAWDEYDNYSTYTAVVGIMTLEKLKEKNISVFFEKGELK